MISEKCKEKLIIDFVDGLSKFNKEEFTTYRFEIKYLEGEKPLISAERILSNEQAI